MIFPKCLSEKTCYRVNFESYRHQVIYLELDHKDGIIPPFHVELLMF